MTSSLNYWRTAQTSQPSWRLRAQAEREPRKRKQQSETPDDVPEHALPPGDSVHVPAVLADAFGLSTSEARRLIAQGGVKIDGRQVVDLDMARADLSGALVQAGKRRFVRLSG